MITIDSKKLLKKFQLISNNFEIQILTNEIINEGVSMEKRYIFISSNSSILHPKVDCVIDVCLTKVVRIDEFFGRKRKFADLITEKEHQRRRMMVEKLNCDNKKVVYYSLFTPKKEVIQYGEEYHWDY